VLGTYHDDEIEQEWLVEQWLVELKSTKMYYYSSVFPIISH